MVNVMAPPLAPDRRRGASAAAGLSRRTLWLSSNDAAHALPTMRPTTWDTREPAVDARDDGPMSTNPSASEPRDGDGRTVSGHRQGSWIVWRQDDNGNRCEVARLELRADADALAAVMESRGHKQIYWVSAAD
jgi:hypothetical protein